MKDRLTVMAIGGALFCVFASMVVEGGNPAVLIKPAPLLLVFGGTAAAALAGLMRSDVGALREVTRKAVSGSPPNVDQAIETLVDLAKRAKSGSILSLENEIRGVNDTFLKLGVQLAVDGGSSEDMRDILESEIQAMTERHRLGAKFFSDMGGFAPTLGILGTVLGLIHVLGHLSSPGSLGPAIGSAFTATLWGVLTANLVWLPLANKLKRMTAAEVQVKHMQLEGLLAIQAGSSSRAVRTRMEVFLPAGGREQVLPDRRGTKRVAA